MQTHHWFILIAVALAGYYAHKFYPGILPGS